MDGIGLAASLAWPSVVLHINLLWMVTAFCVMLIWHALTGRGRRGGM